MLAYSFTEVTNIISSVKHIQSWLNVSLSQKQSEPTTFKKNSLPLPQLLVGPRKRAIYKDSSLPKET